MRNNCCTLVTSEIENHINRTAAISVPAQRRALWQGLRGKEPSPFTQITAHLLQTSIKKSLLLGCSYPEAKYTMYIQPRSSKSISQLLNSPTSPKVIFIQNWNVFSILKLKLCVNYTTKNISWFEMVWTLGFIPRVVSCYLKVLESHFHSSFPSSPRISDLAQSLAHSGMWSKVSHKFTWPSHSTKGGGRICGLGKTALPAPQALAPSPTPAIPAKMTWSNQRLHPDFRSLPGSGLLAMGLH